MVTHKGSNKAVLVIIFCVLQQIKIFVYITVMQNVETAASFLEELLGALGDNYFKFVLCEFGLARNTSS